jgi:general secretion pathway protein D
MKKRVLWKNSISSVLITGCLLSLSPTEVEAQFKADKYKTKSRFNSPSNTTSKSANNFIDDDSNTEAFGARTSADGTKPDSSYVNLNFETAYGPEIVEKGFNFPDSDIMEVTKHMQELTGINLILDKDVKGKISITTSTAITVGDAWKAYLAALNMAGYTLVKSGAYYKIINARDVRYVPTKIYTGAYTPETEAHIMKIMALKNVDASEISRNFRPFMSRYGRVIDIKQTNTLIISDTGANIARLEKIIKFLDVPGYDETLQIIPVRNSSAQEIAKLLDEILRGGSSSSSRKTTSRTSKRFSSSKGASGSQNISKIIAEPRTNSIIAMANAEGAAELRNLIKKLDVKYSSNQADKIHVHYLNHGNAEELSKTLSNLVSGAKATRKTTGTRSFITRGSEGSTLFNGEVKITADKNNNALVVTAAPTDWLTIKNVIGKLDIPRDQVYVEGLILETTANRTREFGVEYLSAYGAGNAQRVGYSNGSGDLTNLLAGNPTSLSGFFVGGGGEGTVEIPNPAGGDDIKVNGVNGLIKAIASNTNTNVLATPQILALDNTEAEFEVGATVPVRKSETTNGTVTTSTETQEAKLSLKITPQINKVTRFVKLKINQTINDFVGDLDTSGNGQATTTRSAVTEVIVRDRDTIAMGGLLRDKESVSYNKVPLLGDIPVLGWLFKSKSKKIDKTNLLMFLTPKILSPYGQTASKNTYNALENRMENLQNIIDDENENPFPKEVEELTKKVGKQIDGPLYDTTPNTYQRTNQNTEGIGSEVKDTPNYQDIVEELER